MNDNYHRPKRKIIQKVMEVSGKNPEHCASQKELDRLSELVNVRNAFQAMGLDPQKLYLRLCEQDPRDCEAFDTCGNLVGWEVVGLCDQEVEKHNARATTIKDMVYRDWTQEELVAEIARTIKVKDAKIAKKKSESPEWPFACVHLVIPTDEDAFTREMAESMRNQFSTLQADNIKEAYLLLSYDPSIGKCPLVRIR